MIVPARSEMIVSTKMQFRKIPSGLPDEDWSTDLTCVRDGLHVSRKLIPRNSRTDIPVRVINVKEEPIALKSVVSKLQEVDVVDKDFQHSSVETQVKQNNEEDAIPEYLQKLINGIDWSIPESTSLALEAILVKHAGAFSQDENDLGETNIMMH